MTYHAPRSVAKTPPQASAVPDRVMVAFGLLAVVLAVAPPVVSTAPVVFDDESSFVAATGASVRVLYPNQAQAVESYAEGGVTLRQAGGELSWVGQWTNVLPGFEYALNNAESFDVTLDAPAAAFGIYINDGFSDKLIDTSPGQDSAWAVRFLLQGSLVHDLFIDPPMDAAYFLGVALGTPFDRVEFREYVDGVSCPLSGPTPCYEDDHFGRILLVDASANQGPDCFAAAPSLSSIWPPNHAFRAVGVVGVPDPDGDPVTIRVTTVHQDEPVDALGDGASGPDARGLGEATVDVRAERSGTGNGRVYALGFEASDGQGGTCTGAVAVEVRHNVGAPATDDGPAYDSAEA